MIMVNGSNFLLQNGRKMETILKIKFFIKTVKVTNNGANNQVMIVLSSDTYKGKTSIFIKYIEKSCYILYTKCLVNFRMRQ